MRELKLEELTLEQKIGQLICVRWFQDEEDKNEVLEALARCEVGAIQGWAEFEELTSYVRKTTDYNVLICADMETGFRGGIQIPYQMAISYANDEKLAYEMARVTAIEAKNAGYSVVWGPVVSVGREGRSCSNCRTFGSLEDNIKCGTAMLRGYQDEGMIATMKHFPGSGIGGSGDSHMLSTVSESNLEDLMTRDMQPYFAAIKSGDLMGIMTTHRMHPKIDNMPSTFSSKILNVIREQGFDGIIFSDSLAMMAIESVYGKKESLGLAIAAGVDMVLPSFTLRYREIHAALMEAYHKGVFTEERLNDAVRHVLEAQRRTMKKPSATELSERQKNLVEELNAKSLCAVLKAGVDVKLDPNKKKLFVLLHETNPPKSMSQELAIGSWFLKEQVEKKKDMIQEAFPDAEIMLLNEFPHQNENAAVVRACAAADEVIFFTFCKQSSYLGSNCITERIKSVLEACMYKTAAVVHMGNPYEAIKFKDAPRIFLGVTGSDSEKYAIKALKGEFIPTGKAPSDLGF